MLLNLAACHCVHALCFMQRGYYSNLGFLSFFIIGPHCTSGPVGTDRAPCLFSQSDSCQSVRLLIMTVNFGKTADWIEMPVGVVGWMGLRNSVLDGCPHWRHLANMVERWCVVALSGTASVVPK